MKKLSLNLVEVGVELKKQVLLLLVNLSNSRSLHVSTSLWVTPACHILSHLSFPRENDTRDAVVLAETRHTFFFHFSPLFFSSFSTTATTFTFASLCDKKKMKNSMSMTYKLNDYCQFARGQQLIFSPGKTIIKKVTELLIDLNHRHLSLYNYHINRNRNKVKKKNLKSPARKKWSKENLKKYFI